MPDYEASSDIDASADTTFAYLRDVHHLPTYFSRMTSAEPGNGESVHVSADVHGDQKDGEAWFRVDDAARALSWGSEGPNNYHGQLRVEDSPDGDTSSVTVTVSTDRVATDEIQHGLEETVANIRLLLGPANH